jgi:two-component system sensor histidine kinase and response regulator WspE
VSEQSKNIAPKIIELFRNELERHSETLDRGLIEAENNNSQSTIEPLMRAAHSIKGAARIVRIMEAVELAHAMEDLLSLAMNGKIMLNSLMIDLLLNANDVFIEISKSGQQDIFDYFAGKSEQISELSAQLRNLAGKKNEQISELQTASNASLPRKKIKDEITAKTEGAGVSNIPASFVRVDSEQLNKILGLAGETLIKTKTIKNLTDNVSKMKFILREILTLTSGRNIYRTKDNELYNKNLAEHLYALRDLLNTHSYDLAELDLKLESLTGKLYYESVTTHMRPFAEGIQSFYRLVRDIAKELQKKVKLVVSGETTKVDRNILEQLEAPLNHLVRNAIDHGIEMPEERRRAGKP